MSMDDTWFARSSGDWEGQGNDVVPTSYLSKHPEDHGRRRIESESDKDLDQRLRGIIEEGKTTRKGILSNAFLELIVFCNLR